MSTTTDQVDVPALRTRIAEVRARVGVAARRSGRTPESVTIVAVSKTFPRSAVDAAIQEGITTFGENRVQEARDKFATPLPQGRELRLIGQLQTNKVRHAVALFDCIESVDRLPLVEALEREATRLGRVLTVLIQVNVAREPQKAGCAVEDAGSLLAAIREAAHLRCDGLMTIAPLVADSEDARPAFTGLRTLRDRLQENSGVALPVLSMGMSDDFAVAVAEGATHVRLGRAIFGAR